MAEPRVVRISRGQSRIADEITFTWTCQHCKGDDGDHHEWCRETRSA